MPPLSPLPPKSRLESLDVLRGLAALAVCLYHFTAGGFLAPGTLSLILTHGYLGFDVFFVISGFVIPLALYDSGYAAGDYGGFLWRRFLRLYPAYLVAGVLAMALWYAGSRLPAFHGSPPRLTPVQFFGNLTLTADLLHTAWINPVYWTLAIELQFYLLIGLAFPWLQAGRRWQRMGFVALWLVPPLLCPLPATVLEYAALFGVGIFCCLRARRLITLPECVLGLTAATLVHGVQVDWLSASVGLVTAFAILRLPAIKARPLLFLGTISYSLYLVHVPFGGRLINLAQRLPADPALRLALLALATGATIAAAWIFHRLVERPFHEWSRSVRFRKPPAAGPLRVS